MTDQIKALWAGLFSVGTTGGGLVTGEYLLAGIGVVVGILTIIERVYTICIKQREKRLRDLELDRITKRHERRHGR